MKDHLLSSASVLAFSESWRQHGLDSPVVLGLEPKAPTLVRRLSPQERQQVAVRFEEGDDAFTWYGAFATDGTFVYKSNQPSQSHSSYTTIIYLYTISVDQFAEVPHHPVRDRLRITTGFGCGLKVVGEKYRISEQ